MNVADLNFFLAAGTVALQLVTAALIGTLIFRSQFREFLSTLSVWGLWVGFGVSFLSAALALFYSDILGFEPCSLCWWQRIFLFPQIILLGTAAWKKDVSIATYSIILSLFGFGFAFYQHLLQVMPQGALPCPSEGVSCAQRILFEFGYVTFPLMSATLFAFLIALMFAVRIKHT